MSNMSKEEVLAAIKEKYDEDIIEVRKLEQRIKRRVALVKRISMAVLASHKYTFYAALVMLLPPLFLDVSFLWSLGLLAYIGVSLLAIEYLLIPFAERQKRVADEKYEQIVSEYEAIKRQYQES